jgi:putative membrane protein
MDHIKRHWPAFLLAAIYFVGILGFLLPGFREACARLTALNLLVGFSILMYCHRVINRRFFVSAAMIALIGFFIEVIGVKTGSLFGSYTYGTVLGPMIMETPLMIGVNWIMLVYLSAYIARRISANLLISSLIGAGIMTGLDVLIEPFAIQFGLWTWTGHHVPLQNYIMWFILSFVFNMIFQMNNPESDNKAAIPLLVCMTLFFLVIDAALIW